MRGSSLIPHSVLCQTSGSSSLARASSNGENFSQRLLDWEHKLAKLTERYAMQIPDLLKYLIVMNHAPLDLQSQVCLSYSHNLFQSDQGSQLELRASLKCPQTQFSGLIAHGSRCHQEREIKGHGQGQAQGEIRGAIILINVQSAQQRQDRSILVGDMS